MQAEQELDKFEKDIRPEDFKEGSPYRTLVKKYGGELALDLARCLGGSKLHVLTEDTVTKGARERYYEKMKKSVVV